MALRARSRIPGRRRGPAAQVLPALLAVAAAAGIQAPAALGQVPADPPGAQAGGGDFLSAPVPDRIVRENGALHATFRDWVAVCTPGADACRAITDARDGEGGDSDGGSGGADAVSAGNGGLIVQSDRLGLDYRLVFVPGEHAPRAGAELVLLVDGERVGELGWQADDGYFPAAAPPGAYTFGQARSNLDLLPAMRAGAVLEIRYTGEDGTRRGTQFSLLGLTSALRWMDAVRAAE